MLFCYFIISYISAFVHINTNKLVCACLLYFMMYYNSSVHVWLCNIVHISSICVRRYQYLLTLRRHFIGSTLLTVAPMQLIKRPAAPYRVALHWWEKLCFQSHNGQAPVCAINRCTINRLMCKHTSTAFRVGPCCTCTHIKWYIYPTLRMGIKPL